MTTTTTTTTNTIHSEIDKLLQIIENNAVEKGCNVHLAKAVYLEMVMKSAIQRGQTASEAVESWVAYLEKHL